MPFENNFCFYSTHDFPDNYDIKECLLSGQSFSLINCNIRSLSANHDKLSNVLSELDFPFSLIGVTEIKQKIDQPPISITLTYVDISISPSEAFPILGELLST